MTSYWSEVMERSQVHRWTSLMIVRRRICSLHLAGRCQSVRERGSLLPPTTDGDPNARTSISAGSCFGRSRRRRKRSSTWMLVGQPPPTSQKIVCGLRVACINIGRVRVAATSCRTGRQKTRRVRITLAIWFHKKKSTDSLSPCLGVVLRSLVSSFSRRWPDLHGWDTPLHTGIPVQLHQGLVRWVLCCPQVYFRSTGSSYSIFLTETPWAKNVMSECSASPIFSFGLWKVSSPRVEVPAPRI